VGVLSDGERWKVIHGDCLEVLRGMPDNSVDAVVTDPPYSSGGFMRGDRMASTRVKYQTSDARRMHPTFSGDNRDQRGFLYWCALWLAECRRIAKPGGMVCVFTDWRQLPTTTDAIQAGGWIWRGIVPWDKVNARPQANRFTAQAEYLVWGTNGPDNSAPSPDSVYGRGVLREAAPCGKERQHSTQKPVGVLADIVRVASREGGTVLDPFAGSGTTGAACVQTGRKFIGIELDAEYVEIARARIAAALEPLAVS
jgi:site-specific DNA-methyltransferase (adenine-specific)